MNALKITLVIGTSILISCHPSSAQEKWSKPVVITEMNNKKIEASFCTNVRDTIKCFVVSECGQLDNSYARFSFKYLDTLNIVQVRSIDEISLIKPFSKIYSFPANSGVSKILEICIPTSVQAYCH